MGIFKAGDKVKEKNNFFGKGDKVGVVKSVNTFGFLAYQVRFKGLSGLWEYHKGELKKVKDELKGGNKNNGKETNKAF